MRVCCCKETEIKKNKSKALRRNPASDGRDCAKLKARDTERQRKSKVK